MALYRSKYPEGGLWNGCSLCSEGSRSLTISVSFLFDAARTFYKEDVKDVKTYYLHYKALLFST